MKHVLKALLYAEKMHKGQTRKVSGDPYITHPIAVSYIIPIYKKSKKLDEILAAAILHDVLEDTAASFISLAKEFTPLIASLVYELTNDPVEIAILGKLEYQKKKLAGISNYGLLIKLADRLHNISDSPSKKQIEETKDLISHIKSSRLLTKSHLAIISDIEELLY